MRVVCIILWNTHQFSSILKHVVYVRSLHLKYDWSFSCFSRNELRSIYKSIYLYLLPQCSCMRNPVYCRRPPTTTSTWVNTFPSDASGISTSGGIPYPEFAAHEFDMLSRSGPKISGKSRWNSDTIWMRFMFNSEIEVSSVKEIATVFPIFALLLFNIGKHVSFANK